MLTVAAVLIIGIIAAILLAALIRHLSSRRRSHRYA